MVVDAVVAVGAAVATDSNLRSRSRGSALACLGVRVREVVRRREPVVRQVRVDLRRRKMLVSE